MKIKIDIPDMTGKEFEDIEAQFQRSGWKNANDVFSDAIRQCLNVGTPLTSEKMREKWEYKDHITPRPEITTVIAFDE